MKSTKRLRLLFMVVCCIITLAISPQSITIAQRIAPFGDLPVADTRTPASTQDSPAAFPTPNDHTFVTSSGGALDRYVTRNQVTGGKLDFDILITRFFFHPSYENIAFDSDGFLTADAITRFTTNGVLPKSILLQLRVFDVDGSASPCPEIDRVLINLTC